MNVQKFTLKSQEALQTAQEIAHGYGNQSIEPVHLLAAMIQDASGIVPPMLMKIGANVNYLKIKINEQMSALPKVSGSTGNYVSQDLNAVLEKALQEAKSMNDEYASVEHLLIACAEIQSPAAQLLKDQGVQKDAIKRIITETRGSQRVTDQHPEDKYQALQKYGRILNDEARKGKIDPVIGREDEIRRILQVLSRRTKNNPVIIGEPGVGKTAIVEGIAQRIISGDVPDTLRSKTIVALDLGALVAGTSFRGQF